MLKRTGSKAYIVVVVGGQHTNDTLLLLYWEVYISNHFLFRDIRPNIHIMKENRKISQFLSTHRKPFFIKIGCSSNIFPGAYVAGYSALPGRNDFVYHAKFIFRNLMFYRYTKIYPVFL